jgi:hypothetical protein
MIYRPIYFLYRLFFGSRHRLGRRFTRDGWLVIAGLIAAMLMGSDTENTVAYQGFSLVACLLVIAIGSAWFFRARFSATRTLPRFGTVGRPVF